MLILSLYNYQNHTIQNFDCSKLNLVNPYNFDNHQNGDCLIYCGY